mmetsp:Transcript_37714/g.66296  ORF Transcript_37714/g.66296 Transcript_37714/m.66296 type:complete len:484 (+) Transcript_37714:66-1517(+)
MTTRVSTPLCYILFAFLLPSAAREACAASETSSCEPLAKALEAEAEGQGLELLQKRGKTSSARICPVPDILNVKTKYATVGKGCEPGHCLEGNRAYDTFSDAWEKCGLTVECSFVMKHSDGNFYLRRDSDPDDASAENVKVFSYDCPQTADEMNIIDKKAVRMAKKLARQRDLEGLEGHGEEAGEEDDMNLLDEDVMDEGAKKRMAGGPHLKLAPLAEDNGCPVPRANEFAQGGKRCPHEGACLLKNQAFPSLTDAWEECAMNEFCGAVLATEDGSFYLRRESDPDDENDKHKLYAYPCKDQAFEKEAIRKRAKAKAAKMVNKDDPLEKFQLKVEMHDEKGKSKAEVKKELNKRRNRFEYGQDAEVLQEEEENAEAQKKAKRAKVLSKVAAGAKARIAQEKEKVSAIHKELEETEEEEEENRKIAQNNADRAAEEEEEEELEKEISEEEAEVEDLAQQYEALWNEAQEETKGKANSKKAKQGW